MNSIKTHVAFIQELVITKLQPRPVHTSFPFTGHSQTTLQPSCGTLSSVSTSGCRPTRSAAATPTGSLETSSPRSTTTPTCSSSRGKWRRGSLDSGHLLLLLMVSSSLYVSDMFVTRVLSSLVFRVDLL